MGCAGDVWDRVASLAGLFEGVVGYGVGGLVVGGLFGGLFCCHFVLQESIEDLYSEYVE